MKHGEGAACMQIPPTGRVTPAHNVQSNLCGAHVV